MILGDFGHTIVATALDPDEAVVAAREHQPEACLLDVYFPSGNGLRAIRRIHAVSPDTKVVILAGSINGGLVSDALAHGAQGFVCKAKPIGALIDALDIAQRGYLAVDPLVLKDARRPRVQIEDPLWLMETLTRREWEVLRCIVDGLSTQRIADQLGMHRTTARTHVQNLLTKLGVHSRLQAAAMMAASGSAEMWPVDIRPRGVLHTA